MMPVKEILELKHLEPLPPVLVIDETTIKTTSDAGPVCGCDEKYEMVKKYKPFIPGGVHPYAKKNTTDSEQFVINWQRIQIGACGYVFEKPVALHPDEIPKNFHPNENPPMDMSMFLRKPKYTDGYIQEKLNQCDREHSMNCNCGSDKRL